MSLSGMTPMSFGKHKGESLQSVFDQYPDYVDWLMGQGWFEIRFPDEREFFAQLLLPLNQRV